MNNPYAQYQTQNIATAPPEKLLIMLYDGAIKFLKQGLKALDEKKYDDFSYYISRTQDIISELMVTLDMDYEISKNLYQLYDYFMYRLIHGNVKKDRQSIEEVQKHLEELRETWVQAAAAKEKATI
ncbi:flagellar export chaperone FliS [Carboxydothermus hydrogenoformans]|uniref:Flagellar protein FliS n=1 Tax=Carboxydothermus hydrogenoformans (strain ATCC BAA-161 / DSM 6008 / Z-2901) TaxID=246194 RepID=Q3ADF1_CARHZ|nr:flagellar export chaperone FliS [Carboxydothermus hydrogenoformans]ABB16053.1 flagellar protein FliS [Carboxydothermus hydrogenoformans Z-2901]